MAGVITLEEQSDHHDIDSFILIMPDCYAGLTGRSAIRDR